MICLGLFSSLLPLLLRITVCPSWACHPVCHSQPALPISPLEHDHLAHFFLPLFLQVITTQYHPTMAISHTVASSAGGTLQLTFFTYCKNKVKGTERSFRVRATGKARREKKQREFTGTWKKWLASVRHGWHQAFFTWATPHHVSGPGTYTAFSQVL